ncbi:hypothetical protein GGR26_001837 [Lewinella marina]|uniref:Outer membrane lipoprotein-sorting protein n=1 Tax=Neolewinella marina TaxID=438751 RepID=A0A2G0CHJ8_9BACT|nr:DUF6503 family protein [Neolewinella marina]NJB86069.1 hypothetical protein [Neolewinella marina]PHK99452.1 hypothetical protein CGL56_08345 [Neolewinella marina]
MPYLALLLLLALMACQSDPAPETEAPAPEMSMDPYAERVAAAYERLGTSAPAQKVLRAIEAHGGLEAWYANSPLYFHFNYQPLDDGSPRNTLAYNDYRRSRAVHLLATDTTQRFGFDGQQAWSMTGERVDGMSPRFWSLTPYYFVGLPFVLADEGIHFEALPAEELDGTTYDLVKVTYAEGTGDADQDYYVLYLNPETAQLDALRYIVSYPGYFPDGGQTPEKLMKVTGKTKVDGITLPTGYDTHYWNDGNPGEKVTETQVTDYAFRPELGDDFFNMPADARVFNDLPE